MGKSIRSALMPVVVAASLLGSGAQAAAARESFITLASTTSTENSGLFEAILPVFTAKTGIEVRVVAVGTGQALRISRNGDADVLIVHDRVSEDQFVAEGWGVERHALMHNDFLIVGPKTDPAVIRGLPDVGQALSRIAEHASAFASRADDSGTHKMEMRLWKFAGIDPSEFSGLWYRETGSGMGSTLNTAAAMNAYALTDRGTWLAFKNRLELEILVVGDPRLLNPYGVILVDPKKHPHTKAKEGQVFISWLLSKEGQRAIGDFRLAGEVLFIPDALP